MVIEEAYYSSDGSASHGESMHGRSVTVFVLSPSTQSERHFPISLTINNVRSKLAVITGIPASSQVLELQDGSSPSTSYERTEGRTISYLTNDNATLADYGVEKDGYIIKVSTNDVQAAQLLHSFVEDDNVKSVEMSAEDYAARQDTVMAYKARNKLGRFAGLTPDDTEPGINPNLTISSRVQVDMSGNGILLRRGIVRYIGAVEFARGAWVGIEYDEPVGKNDGSVDGKRYFSCRMKYGGFVKPEKCIISHDLGGSDDELMDDME